MRKAFPYLEMIFQILFLGLMVALVLAQANPLYQTPNRDGGLFMYMGDQLLKGKLLYVDIWDNKGPLVFYINALGLFLGQGYRWGVWGLEFIFVFLAAFLGFIMMKRMWGFAPAIFGTYLWLVGFNSVMRGGNFTEDYSLLFNFAAIYFFWSDLQKGPRWSYQFMIGVMLALSFLLRANNIGVELSIAAALVLSAFLDKEYSSSLKKLAWIAAGSLAVFGLVAIYFYSMGTLEEMVVAGYTYNFFYSDGEGARGGLFTTFTRGLNLLGYPVLPALLGYFVLFRKLPEAIRERQNPSRDFYLFLLLGFPLEVFLSSLSGRNYSHYYICWTPYIALLSGLMMNYLISPTINEDLQRRSVATLSAVILLVALTNLSPLEQYTATANRLLFDRPAGVELIHPVARYVRENTDPSDTILVWGFQPFINLMAQRDSATGILSYPVLVESPYSDELNNRFLQDLIENKPVLIVDMVNPDNDTIPFIDPVMRETQAQRLKRFNPPENLDAVFEYIFANYHVETRINRVMIYRLNDSTP
jgi:hypothetical protein